ncbi:MAG: hypothetical protein AB7N54_10495 [Alphaproteobacteria bacterium]
MATAKRGCGGVLLRAIVLIALGSLAAGCASRDGIVANTTETHGKGAIVAAIVYETDQEISWGGANLRRSYQITLDIIRNDDREDDKKRERDHHSVLRSTIEGKNLTVWIVSETLPNLFYFPSITERAFATKEDDWVVRKTVFPDVKVDTQGVRPETVFGDRTPRFEVATGEVVYIGTFVVRIQSGWRGIMGTNIPGAFQTITEAEKSYRYDPNAAEAMIRDSYLKKLPIRNVNVFDGLPRSLEKLGIPWSQRSVGGQSTMLPPLVILARAFDTED